MDPNQTNQNPMGAPVDPMAPQMPVDQQQPVVDPMAGQVPTQTPVVDTPVVPEPIATPTPEPVAEVPAVGEQPVVPAEPQPTVEQPATPVEPVVPQGGDMGGGQMPPTAPPAV